MVARMVGDPGWVVREVSDITPRDAARQTPHTWHLGTNNIPTRFVSATFGVIIGNTGFAIRGPSFTLFLHIPLAL